MKNNIEIEKLFQESFSNYTVKPPEKVWTKTSRKLKFFNFFRFTYNKLNIFYVVVLIALLISILVELQQDTDNYSKIIATEVYEKTNIKVHENNFEKSKNQIEETNKNINHNKIIYNKKQTPVYKTVLKENKKPEKNINKKNKQDSLIIKKQNPDINLSKNKKIIPNISETYEIFFASKYSGCAPLEISFFNKSLNYESCKWDFGNGNNTTTKNPVTIYDTPGKYTVSLTVFADGIVSIVNKEIIVFESPLADFVINSNNIFAEEEIVFTNLSENNKNNYWNFGDNTISDDIHPRHTYKKEGIYNIKLSVYSEAGCSDSLSNYNINVKDSKYKIEAPNALQANTSGPEDSYISSSATSNSIFRLVFRYEVAEYNMFIYNEYGQLIFESNDVNKGWNAYYRNEIVPFGVYVWKSYGKFINGRQFYKTGNVTVIYSN